MWTPTIITTVVLYFCHFQQVIASSSAEWTHRRASYDPITLPIHQIVARAPQAPSASADSIGNNATTGANNGTDASSAAVAGANATVVNSGYTPAHLSSNRQSYYVLIKLGEIFFRVALDTASSDLWILSSNCHDSSCGSVPKYPLAYHSPTFVAVNSTTGGGQTPFQASYADGTVATGFVAKEAVTIANLTVPDQAFALVTGSNVTMTDLTSGVLGLGFPRLSSIGRSVNGSTPFFVRLAQHGLLDYPMFGISMRNSTGYLTLGAIDASVVQNASLIGWNPVVEFPPLGTDSDPEYLQWAIPLTQISIGNTTFTAQPTYPAQTNNLSYALIDIGSSGIFGPYQDVSRIFASIDGARYVGPDGEWVVPCDTEALMSFEFGGRNYTLKPSDYLIGPVDTSPGLCLSWPRSTPPSSDGLDWQFGSPFLGAAYTIFSYGINSKEPPMIGLYPLQNDTVQVDTPAQLSSIFASESATINSALPNSLISPSSFTTPPYTFTESAPPPIGDTVSSGLAISTYVALLATELRNDSALPMITPPPSVTTLTLTNAEGLLTTSISTQSFEFVTLGVPPGWNAASQMTIPSILSMTITWTVLSLTSLNFIF
ncbi:acid protease [Pluteus cervinus]|uniref:Acid protease n=1 Tax=Pluteus cervinus TaxID=181527 RepID=A0ACD3B529_9AGAR|nr:acid protease [Pluteus cervinus]